MVTVGCQKGQEELAGRIASLQLLLFQNPTSMRVLTVLDHLVQVVSLLAGPELIRLGSPVQAASQVSPQPASGLS